jgi:lambda family phage portal protein
MSEEVTSARTVRLTPEGSTSLVPQSMWGGYEGAERFNRDMALWRPTMGSPDQIIHRQKELADSRGRDSIRNNGYVAGAASIHKDSVVGAQFRLNARPNWRVLEKYSSGFTAAWADKFQKVVEAHFNLMADSQECWLDASRMNTLTGMVRLAIGVFLATGEVIATCEWVKEQFRPYNSCVQFVRSDRLCNPQGVIDTRTLRRGVQMDMRGKPVSYFIRKGERYDFYPDDFAWRWTNVPARKPWGRKQVIHIIEMGDYGQSRGVSEMVAVLKNLYMTKKFRDVVLESAVVNASYAAAIESELPAEAIAVAMGQSNSLDPQTGMLNVVGAYLGALDTFLGGATNVAMDGVKIPHLFPGTKLNIRNAGTPGGIGQTFEESLLRHTAAGLNVSYESLSRDFSKTNYSSGRLAIGVQNQAMAARKKHVADRLANEIYALVLEEMINDGDVPLPKGVKPDVFYQPLAKEAFCAATWIGSGAGQVDELKETQAAILRLRSGLSTHEIESAKLGYDWRELAEQREREITDFNARGLPIDYISQKPMDKPTDVPQDTPDADNNAEVQGETDENGGQSTGGDSAGSNS